MIIKLSIKCEGHSFEKMEVVHGDKSVGSGCTAILRIPKTWNDVKIWHIKIHNNFNFWIKLKVTREYNKNFNWLYDFFKEYAYAVQVQYLNDFSRQG